MPQLMTAEEEKQVSLSHSLIIRLKIILTSASYELKAHNTLYRRISIQLYC
jgi:hypothetical protein